MPTPVTTARQCLTDEAARALDDAVLVAKRRNHAQTTSLHAISALLSPSISLLRDSLTRCRSSAYSPRLQFRALELCVGVSLDRLPSSKITPPENDDFTPPISNSLMAAIKRSQANQRRQPEMYHFHQLHVSTLNNINNNNNNNNNNNSNNNNNNNNNNNISISSIRVELKHFVLSILDDPIVSRVFGEAGFRSSEIKLAIMQPPRWVGPTLSPSSTTRCPPLFLCNLMDFQGYFGDENCRRIGEVMVKKKERNPLLLGVCAKDALTKFKDCLLNQKPDGPSPGPGLGLPVGVQGSKLVCIENEIREFILNGEEARLDEKIEEVEKNESSSSGSGSGPGLSGGIVVNVGELKVLVEEGNDEERVKKVVKKVSEMLIVNEERKKKVWIIGSSDNYEKYSKFVGKFENVESDWDLHPLPITTTTTSRSSFDAFTSKSSLMGSFVPFGGFFPTPSDYRPPLASVRPPFARCNSCNEKCQHELSATLREGSSLAVGDQQLPSWLPRSQSDSSMGGDVFAQVKDVKSPSKEKIKHLQEKWDDHCRQAHQTSMFVPPGFSLARLQVPQPLGFPFMVDNIQGSSSSGDSSLNEKVCSSSSSGMMIMAQNLSQPQASKAIFSKQALEVSQCHPNQTTAISVTVTTDLGLGTIYGSKLDLKKPLFQNHQVHSQKFSGPAPISTNQGFLGKKDSAQSSLEGSDPCDYKSLLRKLSDAVAWQAEAISKIVEVVSCCRSGNGRQRGSIRGNIWLSFLGPDKIGKKRIAAELANAISGSKDPLIAVDLSSQDRISNVDSIFVCQGLYSFNVNMSRTTIVDHIAQEMCKKPHSVVFLEHFDEADLVVQNSLFHAIQTGKFRDSRGKEIGINNVVFIASSTMTKDERSLSPRKEFIKFQEEQILEAKNWQMQLAIRRAPMDAASSRSNETTISLLPTKCASNQESSAKRKLSNILSDASDQLAKRAQKTPKSSLDLNLPLEEAEAEPEAEAEASDDQMDIFGRAWLEDFFAQVDGNVVFKPFNFDALADKLMRKVRSKFEETYRGERISLEIDHEVMVQILAASWSSNKEATEHWIEQVLCTSFATAREKYHLSAESIVRLSSCEGIPVMEWASEICLPKSINLGI